MYSYYSDYEYRVLDGMNRTIELDNRGKQRAEELRVKEEAKQMMQRMARSVSVTSTQSPLCREADDTQGTTPLPDYVESPVPMDADPA